MSRKTSVFLLFGAAAALWLATSACQLGDGSCLRKSDCDTGYTCEEGTCRSNTAADAPNVAPSKDASSAPVIPPSPSTSTDAGEAADGDVDADVDAAAVTDGGPTVDAESTDAAPDA
jgi:hypothetical protein